MRRRPAAAAMLAVLLLAAGCGKHENSSVKAVRVYINQVNAIQRDLTIPLANISVRNRELETGKNLEKLQPELDRSARTIKTLERRLDALTPPPEARRLDAAVRELVHHEWELAHEFVLLARYDPAARRSLARAAAAGTQLRTDLHGRRSASAQADALDAYAAVLGSVARRLEQLHPPPVVVPQHRSAIRTYRRTAAAARATAAALRGGKDAAKELHDLQVAVASGSTVAAQRARIAAVVAFNHRVARVAKLAAQAQRERNRLQTALR